MDVLAPTLGLRHRQREQRRRRILIAAGELFSRKGFDETSVEELAAAADVSVPTIYSYFATKSDLLLGLLDENKRVMEPGVEQVLRDPPRDVIDALVTLIMAKLEGGYDIKQKGVWREIWAAALRSSPEQRREFLRLQDLSTEPVARLLQTLEARGNIRIDLDLTSSARTIDAISRNCFRLYLMRPKASVAELKSMMREDLTAFLHGFRRATGTAPPRTTKPRPLKPKRRRARSSA